MWMLPNRGLCRSGAAPVHVVAAPPTRFLGRLASSCWDPGRARLASLLSLLPVLGIALNGVTTDLRSRAVLRPAGAAHALRVFYTVTIGSAALAVRCSGFVGDLIGISAAIALLTLATVPLAFGLAEGWPARRAA